MAKHPQIPDDGFESQNHIQDWLKTRSQSEMVVLAARSALRHWPLLALVELGSISFSGPATEILLPSFRAMTASLSGGAWPDREALRAVAIVVSTLVGKAHDVVAQYDTFATRDAAIATIIAANAARASTYTADTAIASADAIGFVTGDATVTLGARSAFTEDCHVLESLSLTASQLAASPLWGSGFEDMPFGIRKRWQSLLQKLLVLDQNWQVWTNWYDARLRGDPLHKELELARVTELSEEDWKQGPAHVNQMLQEIEDRFAKLPAQDPTAETFALDDQGRITVSTREHGEHLLDTPEQRDWYAEYRTAVSILSGEGPNMLGPAFMPLNLLAEGLPENISDARIATLWSRSNYLRSILARHEEAMLDAEPNPDKLGSAIAEGIKHALGVFHNLTLGDPNLLAAEQIALGPQEEAEITQQAQQIQPVIEAAIEQGLTDTNASELLGEIGEHLRIHPRDVPDRLQRVQDHKTQSNFVASLLYTGRKIRDGALLQAGAKMLKFLSENIPAILEFAAKSWPQLVSTITRVLEQLTSML